MSVLYMLSVADPGIDRRGGGAHFCKNLYTLELAFKVVLEGFRGMLPRKIMKSKAPHDAF